MKCKDCSDWQWIDEDNGVCTKGDDPFFCPGDYSCNLKRLCELK